MSPRSVYLRDQAAKCEWHAQNIGDSETKVELRRLAVEYVVQAGDIESKELTTQPEAVHTWRAT
jgi:hypothetical protein